MKQFLKDLVKEYLPLLILLITLFMAFVGFLELIA